MPSVTTHYGISGPVPFVNVEVGADNRLYVDPHRIRLSGTPVPFAVKALECVDTFTDEVTNSIISGTATARQRGERLLQRFVEPWETRLGMSKEGFRGHGGAEVVGTSIYDVLTADAEALVRVGILKRVEEIPLFVDGVDRDITSDITTRIIYEPLARFTEAMLQQFPEFTSPGHVVQTFHKQVWDAADRQWGEVAVDLPIVDGQPLLLVPKGWVGASLLMSAERYYKTSVLSFAQLEQAVRMSDGKLAKTPKPRLMKQSGLGRGRATNIRVTLRAFENDEDLVAIFRAFVASQLEEKAKKEKAKKEREAPGSAGDS